MPVFLIVDDETQIRTMIKKALDELEYDSDTVANGEEALKALFEKKYDGVFTDLKMPGMDGFDLLNAMNEESMNLPRVVVSAYTDAEKIIKSFQKGIMDFITKPFTPDEIKTAAKDMLKQRIDIKETAQYVKGLIQQNAYGGADKYLSSLFSSYPSSPIPHYLLGLKFLKEGSELKAIKHLKASCALDEGYEPARKLLEEILTENEGKNNNTNKKEQRNGEKR
jgi:CheY-like chemotaxis protein